MAAAPLTPRVRVMVVCNTVQPSRVEGGIVDLRAVRFQITASAFPFVPRRLQLFLVLSSPRKGCFPGYVQMIDDQTEKVVFYGQILPAFEEDGEFVPIDLPIKARFPRAGRYTVQVWFFQERTADVLKMEQPFFVFEREA